MSAKEAVKSMVESLPDDCTFEEIEYRLYLIKSVEEGQASAQRDRTYTSEEGREQLQAWRNERK